MSIPVDPNAPKPVVGGPETRVAKAAALTAIGRMAGRTFNAGKHTIEVLDDLAYDRSGSNLVIRFSLRVTLTASGIDVTPPDLNPITVVNPPMATRDATGTATVNPLAAFRDVVLDILKGYR